VVEAFNRPLPDLGRLVERSENMKPSGQTTANAAPAVFLLDVGKPNWLDKGPRLLHEHRFLSPIQGGTPHPESTFEMKSEADVEQASRLYLTHPINQVLSTKFPDLKCLAQFRSSTTRHDLVWAKKNRRSGEWMIIAILEFKSLGLVRRKEFEIATCTKGGEALKRQEAERNEKDPKLRYVRSCLTYNALVFTKQVGAYAVETDCRFAALFDWHHLVLLAGLFTGQPVGFLPPQRFFATTCAPQSHSN
jgi:hypothetical protein